MCAELLWDLAKPEVPSHRINFKLAHNGFRLSSEGSSRFSPRGKIVRRFEHVPPTQHNLLRHLYSAHRDAYLRHERGRGNPNEGSIRISRSSRRNGDSDHDAI